MTDAARLSFALVGYGEVGKIFTAALVERRLPRVAAWDILLRDPATAAPMKAHAMRAGVELAGSMAELTASADVII
mgnify:CR=1 FL=1